VVSDTTSASALGLGVGFVGGSDCIDAPGGGGSPSSSARSCAKHHRVLLR